MRKGLSALTMSGLLLAACTYPEPPTDAVASEPSASPAPTIAFDDCKGLRVPRDTEVNTFLDVPHLLLEFSYYDPSIQGDRTFRIDFTDKACRTNPDTRRLISRNIHIDY